MCKQQEIIKEDIAITSITLNNDKSVRSVVCVGCAGFADSTLYLASQHSPDTIQHGWCVHTCCVDIVLQVKERTSYSSSSFHSFVASQCKNLNAVTKISQSVSSTKYLVLADPDKSFESCVQSYSICGIRSVHGRKFLTCRDIRCKNAKGKRMETIKRLDRVCCHFQVLLNHLNFNINNQELDLSATSSDSNSGMK